MYNEDIKYIVASLEAIMLRDGYSQLVINACIHKAKLDSQTAKLHRKVVYGVVENYLYLEEFLNRLVNKKIKAKLKFFMLAALYELHFLDGRKAHAVVNRYVDTAKIDHKGSEKFVNAVLRRSLREPLAREVENTAEEIALKYSYPLWLVTHWLAIFERDKTISILQHSHDKSPLHLRVNPIRSDRSALITKLLDDDVEAVINDKLDNAVVVTGFGKRSLDDWDAYVEGYCSVQDLSAMLVGHVAGAKAGDQVLDLCAAPGGKTMDLAERVYPDGKVIANDKYQHKMNLIEENALRLGLDKVVKTNLSDGRILNEEWRNRFDLVLVDAPCSGLGTIAKNPEIKYRKTEKDIIRLASIQMELLKTASAYVKTGGRIIYSTCTIEPRENRLLVERFLSENQNFYLLPTKFGDMIEILPAGEFSDGFFIAVLEKM